MTDDTARRSIDEIAAIATTKPADLAHAEITRLGDWYLDHEAHILAHARLASIAGNSFAMPTDPRRAARAEQLGSTEGGGALTKRLEGVNQSPTNTVEQTS